MQKTLHSQECRQFRQAVLEILVMGEGKTYQQIAELSGCGWRTPACRCLRGDPDN
ncbi:MAG: hypothetical protein KME26_23475 [Oscillatoria princeps RMCB-10]|nr:hypothetical protein [Oscillatoria princeps RMCB-10]